MFLNPFNNNQKQQHFFNPLNKSVPKEVNPPEADLKRCLNFVADYGGCGYWRIIWPENLLNSNNKMMVHTSTVMTFDPNHYKNVTSIKVQRQASTNQKKFVQHLLDISKQNNNFRIIYDIDDIPFREDIPDYNKYKFAFASDEIRYNISEIMNMCGHMTVTCNFMKDYFQSKLNSDVKIDVIPNYIPRFWGGHFYDREKIDLNLEENKKRPRICWSGSGAHFDIDGRVKGKDDFYHINDVVEKTVNDFEWVFVGAVSPKLLPLVKQGKIKLIRWYPLFEYMYSLSKVNANMFIAPLQDNNFNKSKSDIKYLEASALGIPIACQDLCTYENAPIKFKTGDEMIDRIKETLKDDRVYLKHSLSARKFAETRFLETEENIGKFEESYLYEKGDKRRKYLIS